LPSRLLPKNIQIRIQKTVILLVVLYGSETWPQMSGEERRLIEIENRVLRRQKDRGNGVMRSFITYAISMMK
jgi:hypothetical protein